MSSFSFPHNAIKKHGKNVFYSNKTYDDLDNLVQKIDLSTALVIKRNITTLPFTVSIKLEDLLLFSAFTLKCWSLGIQVLPLKNDETKLDKKFLSENVKIDLEINQDNYQSFLLNKKTEEIQHLNNNEDSCLLIKTSGTSGHSKIISLSFENLYYSSQDTINFYEIKNIDKWVLNLPLNHVGGFMILVRAFYAGFEITKEIINSSIISLVPTQLFRLLEKDEIHILKNYKLILLGGAPASIQLKKEIIKKKLPVSITYGMTEACSQICATPIGEVDIVENNVGFILPSLEYKIENSRLFLKGKKLFIGHYFKQEFLKRDGDYYSTQDLFSIKKSYFIHQARADRVIISGGENVNLEETKNKLIKILELIDCHLVPVQDEHFGQVLAAFYLNKQIVTKQDSSKKFKLILKENLPPHEIPKYFFNLDCVKIVGIKPTNTELTNYLKNQGIEVAQLTF